MRCVICALVALLCAGAGEPISIYVAPVAETGSILRQGWLSERLGKAIVRELSDVTGTTLTKSDAGKPNVLVRGEVKVLPDKVEASAQVIDSLSGNTLGTPKAQGTARDLFAVEDSIARQVRQLIERLTAGKADAPKAAPGFQYSGSSLERALTRKNDTPPVYEQPRYPQYDTPVGGWYPSLYGYYPSYGYWGGSWGGNWWNGGGTVIIINKPGSGGGHDHGGNHGGGGGGSVTPAPQPPRQTPTEIRTRGDNFSLVATPPSNTISPTAPGANNVINYPYGNTIMSPPANSILRPPANSILVPAAGSIGANNTIQPPKR